MTCYFGGFFYTLKRLHPGVQPFAYVRDAHASSSTKRYAVVPELFSWILPLE